jgi:hypothetical protein
MFIAQASKHSEGHFGRQGELCNRLSAVTMPTYANTTCLAQPASMVQGQD